MKRIILFILLISISICGFCDEPVSCSDYQSALLSNDEDTCLVLCEEDYHPRYFPNGYLNEEPITKFVDLTDTAIYSISGHVEMTSLDMVDFIYIREVRADSSTIRLLGSYSGIQDIQLYTMRTRYIAIDIYCYNGAVSSTSGYTICISPVEQTSIINATIADKLGIGTTNPTASLDVVGDIKVRDQGHIFSITQGPRNVNFNTDALGFTFNKRISGSASNGELIIQTKSGYTEIGPSNSAYSHFYTDMPGFYFNKPLTVNEGVIRSYLNYDLKLNTFSTTRITILHSNGNVGIGTETPLYKLDVAGKIHSDTIITSLAQTNKLQSNQISSSTINTNRIQADSIQSQKIKTGAIFVDSAYGADFVFDNNYQLRPLQEVYSYVQEHGHLPEIQSAADMQQNGVNMSEFQIQLLQKIEELTLYIIQQEQRIKELENIINY